METLSLDKFNPKKAELEELSKKFNALQIKGIDDVEGYKQVDEARKILKKQRVDIEKQGKEFRASALKFQKDVIVYEKELISIIEPLEIELGVKQDIINLEKHKIKMLAVLPDRKERLKTIEIIIEDDLILAMDSEGFEKFFNEKKGEFLSEKERLLNEEKAKIERDNELREVEKKARLEAEANAKKEIELAKERAELDKKEVMRKAEAEKQAIIDENTRKEKERLEAENQKKEQEQEKVRLEKEAKTKLEKQKKYQQFLKDNNYNENEDYLLNKEDRVVLMRKVAEFIK